MKFLNWSRFHQNQEVSKMSEPDKEKNIDGENLNVPEESKADKKKADQLKKKEAEEKKATEKAAAKNIASEKTAAGKKDVENEAAKKEVATNEATEKKAPEDEANISHPSILLSRLVEDPIEVAPTEIVVIKRKPREPSPDSDDEGTSHPNLKNKNIKKPVSHPNIDRSRIRNGQDVMTLAKQNPKCKEIKSDPCEQMEDYEGHPNVRHTKSKSANHPNHRWKIHDRSKNSAKSPLKEKKKNGIAGAKAKAVKEVLFTEPVNVYNETVKLEIVSTID